MKIPVLIGSVREPRNTPRLARFLHARLVDRGVDSVLVDPRELALPILTERLRLLEDPPPTLVEFAATIAAADAVVIATPEYNKGYPAALKNMIDALSSEWRRKPVGIAAHSTGDFGGSVVLQQLRLVMAGVGAVAIPASMTVPRVDEALSENGMPLDDALEGRAQRFLDELCRFAAALDGKLGE